MKHNNFNTLYTNIDLQVWLTFVNVFYKENDHRDNVFN